jgi:ribosome-binding factor A
MTRSAEKNDVDITQLFKYTKDVEVKDALTNQSAKFYMRLIGDADMAQARVFGLRKSGKLRKELRTPGSDMRDAFINELPEFQDQDTLISSIILLGIGDIQKQAIRDADVPEPPTPKSDASLENLEEYQTAVDEYSETYEKTLEKAMNKIRKSEARRLNKLEERELYNLYEALVVDQLCSSEMSQNYYQMCVYFSVYADPKHKKLAFNGFDDFDNASSQLKERLIDEYRLLEMGMPQLKKLPEVMESQQSGQ